MVHHHETHRARVAARSLRKQATEPERRVWSLVRGRRMLGYKFRRQHPIGPFVVDFYCHELRLVIELDGIGHTSTGQQRADHARTAALESLGLQVIRIRNEHATGENIRCLLTTLPSPVRERGRG